MCSVLETWLSQERFNTTSSNSRAKSEECNFEIYPKDRHDQNLTGKNNTIWPFYLPWFWFRIQEMNESKLGIEQKSSSSSRWRLWTKISNSCEICRAGRVRRLLLSCFIATAKIYWHQSDSWNEPRPIFSWDRLDIPRLTVTGILIFKCTEGAGVGDYSSAPAP